MNGYSKREEILVLTFAFFGFLFDGYDLLIYAYVMHYVGVEFNLSNVDLGFIGSLSLVGTFLGAIIFGMLTDIIGRKKGLMLTIGTYGLATFLTGFSNNFYEIAALRFIAGLGIGGEWGTGFALVNEVYGDRMRGFAGGIVQSSFSLGAVLAIYVSMVTLTNFPTNLGWRLAFIIGGISAIMLAFIRYYTPESKIWLARGNREHRMMEYLMELRDKRNAILFSYTLMLTFGMFFMAYSTIYWWPKTLVDFYGINPGIYSYPLIFASLIQVPIMWRIGKMSDIKGKKRMAMIFAVLTLISLLYWYIAVSLNVPYKGNIWLWPIMLGFIFFQATSLSITVFGSWFGEMFSTRIRSTLPGISYMFGRGIGGGIASIVVPLSVCIFGNLPLSMLSMAIIGGIISLIAIILLPETKSLRL